MNIVILNVKENFSSEKQRHFDNFLSNTDYDYGGK